MLYCRTLIRPIVYDIHDWTCVENSANAIVYRPGWRTFVRRSGYIVLAALLIGSLLLVSRRVVFQEESAQSSAEEIAEVEQESARNLPDLREMLPEIERRRLEEEAAQRRREREAAWAQRQAQRRDFGRALNLGIVALAAPIAFFAVMAPLSALWHRVSIVPAGNRQLRIHSRGIWSSARVVSLHEFPHMAVRATEKVRRTRHAGVARLGYRWKVSLEPSPASIIGKRSAGIIEFHVYHQRDRPVDGARLPDRVRQFVGTLEQMTGIAPEISNAMDYRGAKPAWFGNRHVVAGEPRRFEMHIPLGDPVITSRTYGLDEVSPEMRAQMEALMARAKASGGQCSVELRSENGMITYRDADGVEHRFASVDDMPPDVRSLFEQMRTLHKGDR